MPKAFVGISGQLAFTDEPLERFAFPYGLVAFDVINHARRENEKAAIDPAIALRFFLKSYGARSVRDQRAKAAGRSNGCHGGEQALLSMKSEKRVHIYVSDPVTDRKSTRLNSSHSQISYAVFCLK